MEFEQMLELIRTVSSSNLTHFQMADGEFKISMKTNKEVKCTPMPAGTFVPADVPAAPAAVEQKAEQETVTDKKVIKAPLVGTFYEANSPDAEPFVKVGDTVKRGQVLGIVEAMKLMNEIESEFDGVVKEILVKNEQVVEYGQPLFVIE